LPNQGRGGWVPFEAYDSKLKEIFVSNPDINAWEVYFDRRWALHGETLSCSVSNLPSGPASMALINPDGQTYSFEYAIVQWPAWFLFPDSFN
jgi:hypothetical protein